MRFKKWIGAMLILILGIVTVMGFVACDDDPAGDTVTVTWYDGRQILREDPVEKGSKLTAWTPEKPGYEFLRWYSESSLSKEFNFNTTVVNEDMNIYSKWRSGNVATDERIWYTIGSISGSNWKFVTEKNEDDVWEIVPGYDKFVFERKEEKNKYEIKLTIRPNCKFRFVTNLLDTSTWEGDEGRAEMGLGNLKGFEFADGKNPEGKGKVDCTADDMEYGVVKDAQGNVVFHGGYEFNLPCSTWNIWPAEGSDGIYKFTVKTYPGDDSENLVEWECIEKLEPLESQYDMYLVGTVTGDHEMWHDDYDDAVKLARDPDNQAIWRTYLEVTNVMFPSWSLDENPDGVAAASIKIKNNVTGLDCGSQGESGTKGDANIFLTAGIWCITYEEGTDIVSYEKCDYYVVGTIRFGADNYNFVVGDGRVTPLMTTTDGGLTYKASIGVPDMREVKGYTWLKNEQTADGAPAIYALKVAFGSSIGISKLYGVGDDGAKNLFIGETGTYEITFDTQTEQVSFVKTSDVADVAEPVKVTYYNVTDTEVIRLNVQELIKGDKAEWKPARLRGYKFDGWYQDIDCKEKYEDGADGVQKNLKLYGRYVEVGEEFDEQVYYITGSGQGTLSTAGNFKVPLNKAFMLTKQSTLDPDGLTVYISPEIEMYKGDQFKIVVNFSWKDGTHFGFKELREPNGVFCDEGGTGNVGLLRGKQGVYKFIFHTDPFDYNNNYIEWELVREVEEKATEDMYLVGMLKESGYNSWSTDVDDMIHMTVGEDGVTWSVSLELYANDEFKIYNAINNSYHPNGTGNNITLKVNGLTPGYYTITWNADTDAYTITAAERPSPEPTPDPEPEPAPDPTPDPAPDPAE